MAENNDIYYDLVCQKIILVRLVNEQSSSMTIDIQQNLTLFPLCPLSAGRKIYKEKNMILKL